MYGLHVHVREYVWCLCKVYVGLIGAWVIGMRLLEKGVGERAAHGQEVPIQSWTSHRLEDTRNMGKLSWLGTRCFQV